MHIAVLDPADGASRPLKMNQCGTNNPNDVALISPMAFEGIKIFFRSMGFSLLVSERMNRMHRLFLPVHLAPCSQTATTLGTILGVSDSFFGVPLSRYIETHISSELICVRAPDNVGIHSGISRQSPLVVDFDWVGEKLVVHIKPSGRQASFGAGKN